MCHSWITGYLYVQAVQRQLLFLHNIVATQAWPNHSIITPHHSQSKMGRVGYHGSLQDPSDRDSNSHWAVTSSSSPSTFKCTKIYGCPNPSFSSMAQTYSCNCKIYPLVFCAMLTIEEQSATMKPDETWKKELIFQWSPGILQFKLFMFLCTEWNTEGKSSPLSL